MNYWCSFSVNVLFRFVFFLFDLIIGWLVDWCGTGIGRCSGKRKSKKPTAWAAIELNSFKCYIISCAKNEMYKIHKPVNLFTWNYKNLFSKPLKFWYSEVSGNKVQTLNKD